MLTIRLAQSEDLQVIQRLFVETIQQVCQRDYTPQQIAVWTDSVKNIERWLNKISQQYFLLAEQASQLVGFASLEGGYYLDLMYVHHAFQGQGIASALLAAIEQEAKRCHVAALRADVSITAKPFFEKNGFRAICEQRVIRQDVELTNYQMMKNLEI